MDVDAQGYTSMLNLLEPEQLRIDQRLQDLRDNPHEYEPEPVPTRNHVHRDNTEPEPHHQRINIQPEDHHQRINIQPEDHHQRINIQPEDQGELNRFATRGIAINNNLENKTCNKSSAVVIGIVMVAVLICGTIIAITLVYTLQGPSTLPNTELEKLIDNKIQELQREMNQSLQTQVEQMITEYHQTRLLEVTNNLTSELNSLQSSVDTLTTQVNSPVNLYQNCTEETRTCDIEPTSDVRYWRYCPTDFLLINITDYYTVDMRCEYESNLNYLESPALRRNGNKVWCSCNVAYLYNSEHAVLPDALRSICTLVVIRCPQTMTLLSVDVT